MHRQLVSDLPRRAIGDGPRLFLTVLRCVAADQGVAEVWRQCSFIMIALACFVAACFVAALTGALFRPGEWYERLKKPSWRPPNRLLGPVWTVLYLMIAVGGKWGWSGYTRDRSTLLIESANWEIPAEPALPLDRQRERAKLLMVDFDPDVVGGADGFELRSEVCGDEDDSLVFFQAGMI